LDRISEQLGTAEQVNKRNPPSLRLRRTKGISNDEGWEPQNIEQGISNDEVKERATKPLRHKEAQRFKGTLSINSSSS
jgi:hypothetical protein